jgi:HlyD family secretion protein
MLKRNLYIITVTIAVLVAGAGYTAWKVMGAGGEFVISGIIEADGVHVGSKIGGRVLKVVAQEGQVVKSADVLVLLEPDELNASLAEAQASLRQAEAKYAELAAGYRREEIEQADSYVRRSQEELDKLAGPRQQEIEQLKADWLAAKAQHENAEKFQHRMRNLVERRLVAGQDYDDAKRKAEEAEHKVRAAKERYDLLLAGARKEDAAEARRRLAEAEAKLRQLRAGHRKQEMVHARAAVETARARVELLKTQLAETVIKAPADSIVEVVAVRMGDIVAAGKPVATLVQINSLWVRAYLQEDRLASVHPDLEVKVRVNSLPGKIFRGVIRRIHRQAEFLPRNAQAGEKKVLQVFRTEVSVEDPDGVLRPSMNAEIIIAQRPPEVL